jgi:pyridinium-3,5-biscarboxylic acid mononucleotide synthase
VNRDQLELWLREVAAGRLSPEAALERFQDWHSADLDIAQLDLHRELRSGLPEAVYGEGKNPEDLRRIVERLLTAHGRVLVTRLARDSAESLAASVAGCVYRERARLLTCGEPHAAAAGLVAVLAAGTSDLGVAEEAAHCAEWFGHRVERHYDVGVAGVHRLLQRLPAIRAARVVLAVAGMDGALPTLVAGLVPAPVVAVPTSVGYGASFGGLAALLTMLNACAPGVAVVNIDNGYGAAVLAHRIAIAGSLPAAQDA